MGVGTLKDIYGGSMDHGVMPSHHRTGSGSIIRLVFHQLEKAKLVEKAKGFALFYFTYRHYLFILCVYLNEIKNLVIMEAVVLPVKDVSN